MQMAFFFDQTRCIGCYACVVSCKQWNQVRSGPVKWRRVLTMEEGKYPDVSVRFLSMACCHCESPACVFVCPVNAITKREQDGIVIVNKKLCLGGKRCGFACRKACPYDAPQFDDKKYGKMQKCNFCVERLSENKKPICVEACITKALDAGPFEELRRKYDQIRETEGFTYSPSLKPSVLFRPKPGDKVICGQCESHPMPMP
jgi:anaerobic dimethyl sulfoxide reductase subunit B (iron-sulfur subunit)